MESLSHLLTNWDALITLLAAAIAVVKLTGWGRANAEALQAVVDTIETLQQTEVKQEVEKRQSLLSEVAQDALEDAVFAADRKKKPLPPILRICREALRGLFTVRG
jgi:predicted tellurium resistance membrane protein TerC